MAGPVIMVLGLAAAAWLAAVILGGGNPQVTTLGDRDNGHIVTVVPGGRIEISLPGNPTTGYTWESTVANPKVVAQMDPGDYVPSGGALGAGGTYTFTYRALGPGRTDLTLNYRRTWETAVAPLKTFRVTVVVE